MDPMVGTKTDLVQTPSAWYHKKHYQQNGVYKFLTLPFTDSLLAEDCSEF